MVAEHPRSFGRGETIYDPWHYVPVLARKPGALRNGAPFKDWVLPGAMDRVAYVAVSKFAWALPLYRQSQIFAGQGITIDRATLGTWVARAACALLLAFIRSQPRVLCDETPLPRLDPGRRRTKRCQLWAQAVDDRPWRGPAPPAVGYVFAESRGTDEVENHDGTRRHPTSRDEGRTP